MRHRWRRRPTRAGGAPVEMNDQTPVPHTIAPANWPDAVRGFYVVAGAVAIAWKNPSVAEWALVVLATVASPALARAILDRFRR